MAPAELSVKLQSSSGSKVKDFLNANLINILAAFLFLLLAFFLLYPIIIGSHQESPGAVGIHAGILPGLFQQELLLSVPVQHASARGDQYRGLPRHRFLSRLHDDTGALDPAKTAEDHLPRSADRPPVPVCPFAHHPVRPQRPRHPDVRPPLAALRLQRRRHLPDAGLHPARLHDDRKHPDVAQPQSRGERL